MSQTIVPAPATYGPDYYGPAPTGPLPPRENRLAATGTAIRRSLSGSPGRLRLIAIGAVLSVVLSALLGAWALQLRSSALDRAASSSSHLLLLQNVQTKLVQADADATNSYLGFGLEPQAQRQDYIDSLQTASQDLALAARHSEADAEALGAANAALVRYSGYIALARANNRQGLPVGANYLRTAHTVLEEEVVSRLEERGKADTAAMNDAFSSAANARYLLLIAAIIGIGGLVYAQLRLTRHSHRYLNLPAAAATIGLVAVLVGSAAVMFSAQNKANDVRDGSLAAATGLSDSRVAAFTAKSQESLTLIARGSATKDDGDWTDAFNTASEKLDADAYPDAANALEQYKKAHEAVNAKDLAGDWRVAVRAALLDSKDSGNALFTSYATQTEKVLDAEKATTSDKLSTVGDPLLPTGIALLLVGLLCAAGAWWGVSLRLDEYR